MGMLSDSSRVGLWVGVVPVCLTLGLMAEAARAQPEATDFDGTYLHRSRGKDYLTLHMIRSVGDDGAVQYIAEYGGKTPMLMVDENGTPIRYEWSATYSIDVSGNEAVLRSEPQDKPEQEYLLTVTEGALPDFNSRPDPYLTEHLLINAYDFEQGGKQMLRVYDIDRTGTGLREYRISLELVDDDGVMLPNGKFKAKHLVQVQQIGGGTWYKKARGSQTDIWVNDDLAILRIYRHREPYEVILQDYENPDDLISAEETATEYPRPPRVQPDPLPRFDLATIPGELIFEGVYQHTSRGYDMPAANLFVKRGDDGSLTFVTELERATYIAVADPEARPREYRYVSREEPETRRSTTTFADGRIVVDRSWEEGPREHDVPPGSVPDFNSRPDPYCIQHLLLRQYDNEQGGRQTFTAFDGNSKGDGYAEYEIALEHVGDEEITIPAGKFTARHLVLTQLTPSDTWYKKSQGLVTDFWVGEDLTIYRILRHREPYEVLLAEQKQ